MDELYGILLNWAVLLSGYPAPEHPPQIKMVSHAWLEQEACFGRHCKVLGWYRGGNVIYLDSRLDIKKTFDGSILVHELVHYLQKKNGGYMPSLGCGYAVDLEREAYAVQQEYLVRQGIYRPVSVVQMGCE